MSNPQPSLAGFIAWFYPTTGIPTQALPVDSPYLGYAYDVAFSIVNPQLNGISAPCASPPVRSPIYMLAVYNLAADNVINWAPDQAGVLYPVNNPNDLGYFAWLRKDFNITGFVPGVITASSDESTSESLDVSEQLKALTISQLQNLKTPYGRTYLGFAQSVGTLWGMS